ncbi:MAG: hypothetical protein BM485_01220 [Desulfobulbaceae bacterium DB1]|nr:MAG: hypothetical protein BM485_01220 [Desulfobulbaceae bacterium DB1]
MFAVFKNQKGVTLVETMVAIAVLTIGVLAALGMQIQTVGSSSSAMNRTGANSVALSLLENLKSLSFDDPNLVQTTATAVELDNIRTSGELQLLIDAAKVRTFTAAQFPEMQFLIQMPPGGVAGDIVDRSDIFYHLAWDVKDRTLATGEMLNKTIRVFMIWDSPMGPAKLEMTTIKYNNISL